MNSTWLKLLVVALASACGLIVEIVAGRMIAPYLGMSLYTWTAIISVVLAGFSVGHWIGGEFAGRQRQLAIRLVGWSLVLASVSTALSLILIRTVVPAIIAIDMSPVATVLSATFMLFFLPSLFVGIPSPVLTKLAVDDTPTADAGRTIGAFFAAGAIGIIIGTLAAGFLFIGWLGITATLLLVAALYVGLGALVFAMRSAGGLGETVIPTIVVVFSFAMVGLIGGRVQAFKEPCLVGSNYYCIRVIDVSSSYGTPARVMVLDHLGHGINLRDHPRSLVSPYVELQHALTELHLGDSNTFRAFFIGGGAYTLPRAWSSARADAEITVAEIDPEVPRTAKNRLWLGEPPNLTTVVADARVALRKSRPNRFDVIIGDAFHDIVIPSHLVTEEFFALVRSRLSERGLYLMNVVDSRRQPRLALSIFRTLQQSMPSVEVWVSNEPGARATLVLAGLPRPTQTAEVPAEMSPGVVFRRLSEAQLGELIAELQPMVLSDDHAPVDRLIGVD